MFWAAELLHEVYGPEPSIHVQHSTDTIGSGYFAVIRDKLNGNHVMIFVNAEALVRWRNEVTYRVGDRVRLSTSGEVKAPQMAGVEGRVLWVSKVQVYSVEFVDARRHRTMTLMLYAHDLRALALN